MNLSHPTLIAATLTLGLGAFAAPTDAWGHHHHGHPVALADEAAGNLLAVLESDAQFSTLVELIKTADLEDTLRQTGGFTFFAPNNAAFENADPKVIEQVTGNKGLLKKTLLGHVLDQKMLHTDLQTKIDTKAVSGRKIKIRFKKERVLVNGRTLPTTDLLASNGVIHVIETAILPRNKDKKSAEPE